MIEGLTPKEIAGKLDEFIIGQADAKKAVSIALRNRARRRALGEDPLREEIHPKNIIMIGPTGVGKTEIARRLAKLSQAPFMKVEATKYTEVGYVGRDVESMVRDLVQVSLKMVREEYEKKVQPKAEKRAEERILDILIAKDKGSSSSDSSSGDNDSDEKLVRDIFKKKLESGQLEEKEIEIKTSSDSKPMMQVMAMPGMEEIENQMQDLLGDMMPKKKSNRKKQIKDARKILIEDEIENLLDHEKIKFEAIERVEQDGIIFIDEIDKVAARTGKAGGADVSREGVQRDILPLVEGSTVNTRQGQVRTDHILFIAAGAFHISSVSDLIPELQGRFPIRVELQSLTKDDYVQILKNPRNALTKQYQALLSTENIDLEFTNSGAEAIADIAHEMNMRNENIGARRLHTIMEKLLEEISYAPDEYTGQSIRIDSDYVNKQLQKVVKDQDLSKYVL